MFRGFRIPIQQFDETFFDKRLQHFCKMVRTFIVIQIKMFHAENVVVIHNPLLEPRSLIFKNCKNGQLIRMRWRFGTTNQKNKKKKEPPSHSFIALIDRNADSITISS